MHAFVCIVLAPQPGENRRPVTDKLYYTMFYRVHLTWVGFELTTLVVIHTNCICSYKTNYQTITTMAEPMQRRQTHLDFAICLYEFPIDLGTVLVIGVVYCIFHFIVPLYN
jgi:hypothetical protein